MCFRTRLYLVHIAHTVHANNISIFKGINRNPLMMAFNEVKSLDNPLMCVSDLTKNTCQAFCDVISNHYLLIMSIFLAGRKAKAIFIFIINTLLSPWGNFLSAAVTRRFTACFGVCGRNRNTRRNPTPARKRTCKLYPVRPRESNPGPSCSEATVLTTAHCMFLFSSFL